MPNCLDTGAFAKLLTAIDHKMLPPEILGETFLTPITALEAAQHTPKLRIMREHQSHLRPLRNRYVRNPEAYDDFVKSLSTEKPDFYRGALDALHAQAVMHPPFLKFHLSRYGNNPPKTVSGSQRFTSDVRDSLQLIVSQEMPLITCDKDLQKKVSPMLRCHVIHSDLDANCILAAMRFVNLGWLTADKVGTS